MTKTHGPPITAEQHTPDEPLMQASVDDEADKAEPVGSFPHEKLDAYRVALEIVALANKVAEQIPRGHRNIADPLLRAAQNTVLLLAEGANRRGPGLKRQRFVESRGECGEVAAAADVLLTSNVGTPSDVKNLKHHASRVSAMLTRLIARQGG
jgi:four helix bundle protein